VSSSGGGPSCGHLDPKGDVGTGSTEISLGSDFGVALMGVDSLVADGVFPWLELTFATSSLSSIT
jgi:hypothetical protein